MVIMFYLLLTVGVGWCTNSHSFLTKTVGVGQNVTLSCIRHHIPLYKETLFWIRLISGNRPELLGGTFTFDYDDYNNTSHIIAKQEPGTFILHISKAKLSDTGLYYCVKVRQLVMTFLEGTFLRITGPEADITDIQMTPSVSVHAGDPVSLQCSVLSISDSKTCPGNHSVYWFKYSESHPSLIYAHGNHGNECERSPETSDQQKCVYSFSKNVTPSDAGSYYCAVATCGQIIFGSGTKLDTEALSMWNSQKTNTAVFLLCAALATSVMVIASLIYIIKEKTCDRCSADVGTSNDEQQHQQRSEDSVVYYVPTFAKRKAGKVE